jgi:hypothetical protein
LVIWLYYYLVDSLSWPHQLGNHFPASKGATQRQGGKESETGSVICHVVSHCKVLDTAKSVLWLLDVATARCAFQVVPANKIHQDVPNYPGMLLDFPPANLQFHLRWVVKFPVRDLQVRWVRTSQFSAVSHLWKSGRVPESPMNLRLLETQRQSLWWAAQRINIEGTWWPSPIPIVDVIWGFPQMGMPGYPNSWMVYFMENPIKMNDDWGYPHFRKPPYDVITLWTQV